MIKKLLYIAVFFVFGLNASAYRSSSWDQPQNCTELNSGENDFAPYFNHYDGLLYFNSERKGFSAFYNARRDSNCFADVKIINSQLNKRGSNRSYFHQISDDEAYISSFKMSNGRAYLNLFKTQFRRNSWIEPSIIDELAENAFTAQSTISDNGDMMIFSSSRRNSESDTDLWMTFLDLDGKWSTPVKIDELNSPGNEITPYLAGNDTLYFASNGLGGPGGYDIFLSVRNMGKWERPKPISELNTEYDESDFVMINENVALFSSDRPGGKGKLDIYKTKRSKIEVKPTSNIELELSLLTQTLELDIINYQYYYFVQVPQNLDRNNLNNKFAIDSAILINNDNLLEISYDSINISPTVISTRIAVRPENELKRWTCTLLGNNLFYENIRGEKSEDDLIFNLIKHKSKLKNIDSLTVRIEAISTQNKNYHKDLSITIDKSIISSPKFFGDDKQKIEKYFIPNNGRINNQILESIKQSAQYSKRIVIEHFGKSSGPIELKNLLSSEIPGKRIETDRIEYSFNFPFSNKIAEEFIIVNVLKL